MGKTLFAYSQFRANLTRALPGCALKFVILLLQEVKLLLQALILQFGLFDEQQVVLIQMLNPVDLVLLAPRLQFELAKLEIAVLLQLSELKHERIMRFLQLPIVLVKLGDPALLFILPLGQVLHFSLVQVS